MRQHIVVSGVALAMFSGCASTSRQAEVLDTTQLSSSGYDRFWDVHLPFRRGEAVRDAFLVDENLYVTSTLGCFYVIQAQEGLLRWNTDLTDPAYTIFRPSHLRSDDGQGPLCVVTTTRTYLFNRYNGDILASFTPDFAPGSGAVGDQKRLYIGGADGKVHCLMWNHPFGPKPLNKWELLANGPVRTTPVLLGPDKLLFASQGGNVASCTAVDKAFVWQARTEDAILVDPWVDDSGVYVASLDRSLYKFDVNNGTLQWRRRFPEPLTTPPAVARSIVFQYSPATGLVAINADTGGDLWLRPDGLAYLSSRPGQAVILTQGGAVETVNLNDGQTVSRLGESGVARGVANAVDDRVIVWSSDGRIVCARPDTTPFLRRQQVLAASQRLQSSPSQAAGDRPLPPPIEPPPRRDPFRSERDK